MPYAQDVSRCLSASIGANGLNEGEVASALQRAEAALARLRQCHAAGDLPLLHLPAARADLEACRAVADMLTRGADDIVFFGTGGSSLGAQALGQLAGYRVPGPPFYNDTAPGTRFHFFDNLDAWTLARAFRQFDLKTTRFLVTSKSGGTPETLLQLVSLLEALKAAELDWNAKAHVVLVTEPGDTQSNALRAVAEAHDLVVLDHDPNVGGRFSVLSVVGMLPAMTMGLDAAAVREGAAEVIDTLLEDVPAQQFAPALGAVVNVALQEQRGHTATIMMPYSDRLRLFSVWFQQLWAESLGKDGKGTQPVAAAGPVDQHSQMQLFLDGPADKLLNVIMTETAGSGPLVPEGYRSDSLFGYLAGRTVGDLVDCQQRATVETFARNGRPVRTFIVGKPDERSLGGLMMHFMLETIIAGDMLGVDPFDQPAVEQSKVLTREYLAQL